MRVKNSISWNISGISNIVQIYKSETKFHNTIYLSDYMSLYDSGKRDNVSGFITFDKLEIFV